MFYFPSRGQAAPAISQGTHAVSRPILSLVPLRRGEEKKTLSRCSRGPVISDWLSVSRRIAMYYAMGFHDHLFGKALRRHSAAAAVWFIYQRNWFPLLGMLFSGDLSRRRAKNTPTASSLLISRWKFEVSLAGYLSSGGRGGCGGVWQMIVTPRAAITMTDRPFPRNDYPLS